MPDLTTAAVCADSAGHRLRWQLQRPPAHLHELDAGLLWCVIRFSIANDVRTDSSPTPGIGAFTSPLVATQLVATRHWSFQFLITGCIAVTNIISLLAVFRLRTQDGSSRTHVCFVHYVVYGQWVNEQMTTTCTAHRDGPARGLGEAFPSTIILTGEVSVPRKTARGCAPLSEPSVCHSLHERCCGPPTPQHTNNMEQAQRRTRVQLQPSLDCMMASRRPCFSWAPRTGPSNRPRTSLKESLLTYHPMIHGLAATADKPPHSSRTSTPLLVPTWLALLTTWTYPGSR